MEDRAGKTYESLTRTCSSTTRCHGPVHWYSDPRQTFTHGEISVVQDLQNNLLGLPSITALKLVQRIDATRTRRSSNHPATIPESLHWTWYSGRQVDHQAERRCAAILTLYTPRRVPLICTEEAGPGGAQPHGVIGRHIEGK